MTNNTFFKDGIINEALEELETNPKITEKMFREKYLPLFIVPTESAKNTHVWLTEVAQHKFAQVDVVDNHDNSKVLFTIPPIIDPNSTPTENIGKYPMEAVTQNYKDTLPVNPNAAKKLIEDGLKDQVVSLSKNTEDRYREQWLKMLDYYELRGKKTVVKEDDDDFYDMRDGDI